MHIELIEQRNDIGIALSQEKDIHCLLRRILTSAKQITNADAATLYCLDAQQRLRFEIVMNDSLGPRAEDAELAPIPVYDTDTGHPNIHLVVVYAVVNETTVSIADAHARTDPFLLKTLCDAKSLRIHHANPRARRASLATLG